MAGTAFFVSGVQKRQRLSKWRFLYNHIHFPKLARDSIPLPLVSPLTEVAR